MSDWISAVEAAYSLVGDLESWTSGVLEACGPVLGQKDDIAACHFLRTPGGFEIERVVTRPRSRIEAVIPGFLGAEGGRIATEHVFGPRGAAFGSLCERVPERADFVERAFLAGTRGRFADGCGGIAHSGDGRALAIGFGLRQRRPTRPDLRERWSRVASHLGAGLRLRHALGNEESEEAVLSPNGEVCHARGLPAREASARESLRAAVRRIDVARTRAGRSEVDSALESWPGLVGGRWSLIDRFDADGRRFIVALRNDPDVGVRGLSRREAQVAEFLSLGQSEKEIAYTLGLSPSRVSRCIRAALEKVGVRSRAELAAVFAAFRRGNASKLEIAGQSLLCGSCPDLDSTPLAALSRAEREVATLVTRGRSDAEIARTRGASPRTVQNQLHHIYQKLGLHSRTELAALAYS